MTRNIPLVLARVAFTLVGFLVIYQPEFFALGKKRNKVNI